MQLQSHLIFRFHTSDTYAVSSKHLASACLRENESERVFEAAQEALQEISSKFCQVFASQEKRRIYRPISADDELLPRVLNVIRAFYYAMALMEDSSKKTLRFMQREQPFQIPQELESVFDIQNGSEGEKAMLFLVAASLDRQEQKEFVAMYEQICIEGALSWKEKTLFCKKICAFEPEERFALMRALYKLLCISASFQASVEIISSVSGLKTAQACYYLEKISFLFDLERSEEQKGQMRRNVAYILQGIAELPFQEGEEVLDLFFEFSCLNLCMWSSFSDFCVEALSCTSFAEGFKDLLQLFFIYSEKQGFVSFKLKQIMTCLSSLTFEERQTLMTLNHSLVEVCLSPHDKQEHYFTCLVLFAKVPDENRKDILDFLSKVYGVSIYTEQRDVESVLQTVTAIAKEDSLFLQEDDLHTFLSLVPGNCRADALCLLFPFKAKADFWLEIAPLLDSASSSRTFVSLNQVEQILKFFKEEKRLFKQVFQLAKRVLGEQYSQEDPHAFLDALLFIWSLPKSLQELASAKEIEQILLCHSPQSRLKALKTLLSRQNAEQAVLFLSFLLTGLKESDIKEQEALAYLDKYPQSSWHRAKEAITLVIRLENSQSDLDKNRFLAFSFSTRACILDLLMRKEQSVWEFLSREDSQSFLNLLSEKKLIKAIEFLSASENKELWIRHLNLFFDPLDQDMRLDIPIERLFSLSEEECFALMDQLIPVCERVKPLENRIETLFCLRAISPHQRSEVLDALCPIFQNFPEGMAEPVRLKSLFTLAEERSCHILPYLTLYALKRQNPPFKQILDSILSCPKYCMEMFCKFLKEKELFFEHSWQYSYFFSRSLYIAKKDYQSFIESFFQSLNERQALENPCCLSYFLLGHPGALERSKKHLTNLMNKLGEKDWTLKLVNELVLHCKAVPEAVPLELLELLKIFESLEEQEMYPFLGQLLCAKADVRICLERVTEAMLKSYDPAFPYVYILRLLRSAPERTREAFFSQVLSDERFFAKFSLVVGDFLFQSFFIAPEGLPSFFLFVENVLGKAQLPEDSREVLAEFFALNPDLVERSHAFLTESLAEAEEKYWDERTFWVEQVCMGVVDFLTEYMQVYEEHELYQLCLRLKINLSSEKDNKIKSPYKIHSQHQIWQKEEITPTLVEEEIEGKLLLFDPEGMRQKVQDRSFSFADLPTHINWHTLVSFFDAIDDKIEQMNEETRAIFHSEVVARTTQSYDALKDNLVEDESLKRLLSIRGGRKEHPPESLVGLLGILRYIADQPEETPQGQIFSAREEVLFSASASIQKCATGKKEGIALFYNSLEDRYKLGMHRLNELPSIERAKNLVYYLVQGTILSALSDENPFTCKLTLGGSEAASTIEQLSHQSRYIKNMIGKRIGLAHSLCFDPHTHCLYDRLLTFSLKEMLHLFYEYFTPSLLVESVQRGVNLQSQADRSTYNNVSSFLELDQDSFAEVWDEEQNFSFTRKGAVLLLLKEGYLCPSSS